MAHPARVELVTTGPAAPRKRIPQPAEILYPVSEVAELWRCSVDHVYDLIADGELATVQIAKGRAKTRVPASELDAYVQRHRSRAAPLRGRHG